MGGSEWSSQSAYDCSSVGGRPGKTGASGGRGGNAGISGEEFPTIFKFHFHFLLLQSMTSGSRGTVWHRNEHNFDLINSKNLFLISHFPISFFLVGIV